jgi:hypothetical protein
MRHDDPFSVLRLSMLVHGPRTLAKFASARDMKSGARSGVMQCVRVRGSLATPLRSLRVVISQSPGSGASAACAAPAKHSNAAAPARRRHNGIAGTTASSATDPSAQR